ncbi:hypothetical protein BDD14_6621 [Edaphobacter modestus]|uniref:Uncharacterized protein n=1 Tax=Edaphobacter modestus TaxID=388466 RepID=A0A4Q7XXD9_9BACT|nr:hypothetical protein BDD14_6621 [Edaphobacter modestus]
MWTLRCFGAGLLLVPLFVSPTHSKAQTTAGNLNLAAPTKTAIYSDAITGPRSAAYFDHGYLIQLQHVTVKSGVSNIFVYDSLGKFVSNEAVLWPENTSSVWLSYAAVSDGRRLAASGQAHLTGQSVLNFIAIGDLGQSKFTYLDTGEYVAMQICFGPDGSIWAAGAAPAKRPNSMQERELGVLRHYSAKGELLGNYLKQRAQQTDFHNAWKRDSQIYLRGDHDEIVLFDGVGGHLYRYNLGSNALTTTEIRPRSESPDDNVTLLTGFGLTQDGRVFASRIGPGPRQSAARGLYVLQIDAKSATGTWEPIVGSMLARRDDIVTEPTIGSFLYLLGCEGDEVVYRTQQKVPFPVMLSWSKMW